jgi:hypothetical protein
MPIESCGVTLALPLSNGVEDTGTGLVPVSFDGGGCGDAGEGDETRWGRHTSAVPLDCGGDFGSGGADTLEEYE